MCKNLIFLLKNLHILINSDKKLKLKKKKFLIKI